MGFESVLSNYYLSECTYHVVSYGCFKLPRVCVSVPSNPSPSLGFARICCYLLVSYDNYVKCICVCVGGYSNMMCVCVCVLNNYSFYDLVFCLVT